LLLNEPVLPPIWLNLAKAVWVKPWVQLAKL
jgi:hypothetical protein